MRKFFRVFPSVIFLFAIMISGCQPTPQKLLSRKWMPIDVTGEDITPDMKDNIIKEGSMMIEFTDDEKFISHAAGEATESGTYALSEDGKTISIMSLGRMVVKMQLLELKKNKAVIESNGIILTYKPVEE
jgi:hypothetical protein